MQNWRILNFRSSTPKPASAAETLHSLALQLQPLLQRKEQLLANPTLSEQERERQLQQLSQALLREGLVEFNQLLQGICQAYFRRHEADVAARFEVDDFVIEVQMLTLNRLPQFEPQASGFSTWFSSCILPRVYSDLQRQINPNWGRPQPKTQAGQQVRREAFNFVNALSLDQPLNPTDPSEGTRLENKAPSREGTAEQALLEQQCIEFFIQALQQLRSGERSLLRSLYLEQESQKTLAKTLGITPAAMSVRLKKIHARLAILLGTAFEEECGDTEFCAALRRSDR